MTNREYLSKLDTLTLANWILFEAREIGKMSTQSVIYLAEWLDSEYCGWITVSEMGKALMGEWKFAEEFCQEPLEITDTKSIKFIDENGKEHGVSEPWNVKRTLVEENGVVRILESEDRE